MLGFLVRALSAVDVYISLLVPLVQGDAAVALAVASRSVFGLAVSFSC